MLSSYFLNHAFYISMHGDILTSIPLLWQYDAKKLPHESIMWQLYL